jgi:type IV pilus assembly protein PilA
MQGLPTSWVSIDCGQPAGMERGTHNAGRVRNKTHGGNMFQKMMEKKRNGEGGFTLIELLVVMVIIGLLAAIAIPLFLSQKGKARETALKNDLRNLATYAETYAVNNNGSYLNWDIAAATADGYDPSQTLQAGEQATLGSATATSFCVEGTANGEDWSFDSARANQMANAPC